MCKQILAGLALAFASGLTFAQYMPTTTSGLLHVEYVVNADGSYRETWETRTKVNSRQGIEAASQRRIGYIASLDSVEILEAYTLLAGGQKVPVDPASVITMNDSVARDEPIFSDGKVKVLTFPKVEAGSEVHVKFTRTRHTPLFPGHFAADFTASPHYIYEKFVVDVVHAPGIAVRADARQFSGGITALRPGDPSGWIRQQFSLSQSKAYPSEPSQAAIEDFAARITLSSMPDYRALGLAYDSRASIAAVPTPEIVALTAKLLEGAGNDRERLKRIIQWVQHNIRYVAIYAGAGGYVPHSAQSILDNRYGDCKDHSVLLESMLAAAGIESTPVLIDSGNAYTLPNLPVPSVFDHVITYVPSQNVYLDSTSEFSSIGHLPRSLMGKEVVHTRTGRLGKTPELDHLKDYTESWVNLTVLPNGNVTGTSKTHVRGAYETSSRALAFRRIHADREAIVDELLDRYRESGTGDFSHTDPKDFEVPWEQRSEFELTDVVDLPGPSGMSIPVGLSRGDLKNLSSMTIPAERRFPSNCSTTHFIEHVEVDFPESVQIISVPRDVSFLKGTITYKSSYRLIDRKIKVNREFLDLQSSPFCDGNDDPLWREFGPVLRKDLRAQIIMK